MLRRVQKYIRDNALLRQGDRVLTCVSGGADSIALLDVLYRGGYTPIVAHCNFHLRGAESDRDEQIVRRLCEQRGIDLHIRHFDTTAYAAEHHQGIETAARELRYRWFAELAEAEGCVAIAVAHHQNDQAETLLMNLRRGTGLKGLQGMLPKASLTHLGVPSALPLIRPLLCTTHDYIIHYLRDIRHLEWGEDSTNSDTTIRRNAVRAMLSSWSKAEIEHVARTAEIVQSYVMKLTQHFGIIGCPLTQSKSAEFFNQRFRHEGTLAEYTLYPLDRIEDVTALWERVHFTGMNVTIPYKVAVIPYLTRLDESARAVGAVNVIHFTESGERIGYNTDAIGFLDSIRPMIKALPQPAKRAAVLGSGGASKACVYALRKLGMQVDIISRSNGGYPFDPTGYDVVVNATPVGMYPDVEACPDVLYDRIVEGQVFYDCIYNPEETLFLRRAKEHGASVQGGNGMLRGQAEAAARIWGV